MSVFRKNTNGGISKILFWILFAAAIYAVLTGKMLAAGGLLIAAVIFGGITWVNRRKNVRKTSEGFDKKEKKPYKPSAPRNIDTLTDDDRARFISIANNAGKIEAIKELRAFSGSGLKESKETLEKWLLEENS